MIKWLKLKINIGTPDSPQWIELDDKLAETVTTIPTLNGDVTNNGNTVTLKNSGVTAGTYTKVTVNIKGIVTSGSSLSASDIPSLLANKITQDYSNRFVTDTEKSNWNSKASTNVATTSSNGLMSSNDKSNLDSLINGYGKVCTMITDWNLAIESGTYMGRRGIRCSYVRMVDGGSYSSQPKISYTKSCMCNNI